MNNTHTVEAILKATGAKDFQKAFKQSEDATSSFSGKAGKAMRVAGAAIAAGAAAVGTALVTMGVKTAEAADEVHKGSQRIGVSTDAYQEMDYWASQNGLSHNDMEKAVGRLNQRIGLAEQGNAKYADAFSNLGVEIKDAEGNMRSTEDVMTDSITTLSQMEDESEKAAMASELFGTKLGRELMPALQDGALSMEDASEIAQDMGMVMDESAIQASVAFQDNMDTAKRALGGITREIGAAVLPIFNDMLEWVLDNLPAIRETFQQVFGAVKTAFDIVVGAIQTVLEWGEIFRESTGLTFENVRATISEKMTAVREIIQSVWTTIQEFWVEHGEQIVTSVVETFTSIWENIQLYMQEVQNFIQLVWSVISEIWDEHGEAIFETAVLYFTQVWETIEMAMNYVQEIINQVLGYIVPFIQEQLAKLTAFWEEHGDMIMEAIEVAINFIQTVVEVGFGSIQRKFEFLFPYIEGIVESAWTIISTVIDTTIDVILGLIETFSALLTGDFEGAKEAVTGIWKSMWDGIKGVVEGAWGLVSGAFSQLWSDISGWFIDLKDDAIKWGGNMISGFADGITGKIGDAVESAKGVVSAVGEYVKFWSPAKKGEGRYIEDWGENMIDGFLDGVDSQQRNAQQAMNNIVDSMQPSAVNAPQIDVNGAIARSNAQIGSQISHEISNDNQVQPAHINVNIGGQNFRGFVENISSEQGRMTDLEMQF